MTRGEALKDFFRKTILPVASAALLYCIFRSACVKNGELDYLWLWILCGLPFGIWRLRLWIIPGGGSLGGGIALFLLNFVFAGLIGGCVLVWRLLKGRDEQCLGRCSDSGVTLPPPTVSAAQKLDPLQASFWTRMLYSCLVDADFLDTERFMNGDPGRGGYDDIPTLLARLQAYIEPWQQPKTELNRLRCEILNACLSAGSKPKGIYTLTVPTGGGKTVASLAFALRHAAEHRMQWANPRHPTQHGAGLRRRGSSPGCAPAPPSGQRPAGKRSCPTGSWKQYQRYALPGQATFRSSGVSVSFPFRTAVEY